MSFCLQGHKKTCLEKKMSGEQEYSRSPLIEFSQAVKSKRSRVPSIRHKTADGCRQIYTMSAQSQIKSLSNTIPGCDLTSDKEKIGKCQTSEGREVRDCFPLKKHAQ